MITWGGESVSQKMAVCEKPLFYGGVTPDSWPKTNRQHGIETQWAQRSQRTTFDWLKQQPQLFSTELIFPESSPFPTFETAHRIQRFAG